MRCSAVRSFPQLLTVHESDLGGSAALQASVSTPLSADTRGGGGRLGASPLTRTPVPSTPGTAPWTPPLPGIRLRPECVCELLCAVPPLGGGKSPFNKRLLTAAVSLGVCAVAVEPQQRSEQRRSDGKRQPFSDITKQFAPRPGLSNVMPASDAISKLKGKKGLSSRGGGAGGGTAMNSRLKPSAPSASSASLRQMR